MEAFQDDEWASLSKLFSVGDSDFSMHFNNVEIPSNFSSGAENVVDETIVFPSDYQTNFYSISQESSNNSTEVESSHFLINPNNYQPNYGVNFLEANTFDQPMQYYNMDCMNNTNNNLMMPVFSDDMMEEILQLKAPIDQPVETGDSMQLIKRKPEEDLSAQAPKKRSRVSKNTQKNKRVVQSKKKKKAIEENINDGEEDQIMNDGGNKQSSSISSSEDIDSQEMINGGSTSLNSKGKAKAARGSATDPQSLYARRRREKINERLKILQNLVPNGTKVDISTMLEEAVQYVKFLQLQIKLLSSDEMWMYAPIAYNGMDMGLYHKISQNMWS